MKRLLVSIYKEGLLLLRDIEGVVIMFLMPLLLVIVIALLQHKTFQNVSENRIPVVVVDLDNDSLGLAFRNGMKYSEMFEVTEIFDKDSSVLAQMRKDVAKGIYQIGIIIPENTTRAIKNRAISLVQKQIPGSIKSDALNIHTQAHIKILFDPITKESFRNLAQSIFMQFAASTETRIIFEAYTKFIDALTNQTTTIEFPEEPVLAFDEDLVSEYGGILPNAVQHNVPAWTLFGMFLICIPVAGNIIKERNDGCLARLKTIPVSYFQIMLGKAVVFVIICMIEALLIILVGMFLMPQLGLPKLVIHGNWFAVFSISLASALAATGYGLVIGSIASTQIQASSFGSVSAVILAAIGGVWIPTLIMPDVMRRISAFSPMNWGIHGYYDVFLRTASTLEILPDIIKLVSFSALCILLSMFFRKYHRAS